MMAPAVNVLALSIDHDRLTPAVAGSTGDVWPPRAAWLMLLVALRVVRSVSVRSAGGLKNCLPPAGWLPNEMPFVG